MAYVDYVYYTDIYNGASVPESAFDAAAVRASEILDSLTFGRITAPLADEEDVKRACCAIAEQVYVDEQRGGNVQSESVGSYSVTYREASANQYTALAARYLANTGLMYRGLP